MHTMPKICYFNAIWLIDLFNTYVKEVYGWLYIDVSKMWQTFIILWNNKKIPPCSKFNGNISSDICEWFIITNIT